MNQSESFRVMVPVEEPQGSGLGPFLFLDMQWEKNIVGPRHWLD